MRWGRGSIAERKIDGLHGTVKNLKETIRAKLRAFYVISGRWWWLREGGGRVYRNYLKCCTLNSGKILQATDFHAFSSIHFRFHK